MSLSMMRSPCMKRFQKVACVAVTVALLVICAHSQDLIFTKLTTANGLANNSVNKIYQTAEDLYGSPLGKACRYDGYEFLNFGRSDGLANVLVNDILEDRFDGSGSP